MTTSWTHKLTGTVIERSTIDALVSTWRNSPREHARKAAWRQLQVIGAQLHDVIADLEKRLNRGYDLLEAKPDEKREVMWARWLCQYEAACDALSQITYRVVERRPELVTERRVEVEVRA